MSNHGDGESAFTHTGSDPGVPVVHPQKDDNHTLREFVTQNGNDHALLLAMDQGTDSAATYLDWASQFFLDGGTNDLLASFDFSSNPVSANNHIMHKIRYQNSVHDQLMKVHDMHQHFGGPLPLQHAIQLPLLPHMGTLGPHLPSMPLPAMSQAQLPRPLPHELGTATLAAGDSRAKPGRPCDQCRRKKIRCVIIPNTDNCAQCEAKSLTCTYTRLPTPSKDESAPKRARKSAAVAAATSFPETTSHNSSGPFPGQIPTFLPNSNNIPGGSHISNSNMHSGSIPGGNIPGGVPVHNTYDIVPPKVPIRTVAPVQDYSTMNNSLLKKTLSLQLPRSSFYVGPTSYLFDTNLLEVIIASQNRPSTGNTNVIATGGPAATLLLNNIEQVNLSDKISLRKVEHKTQFVLQDDQTKQSMQTMSQDVDAVEKFVAPHGQILIDLYFRIIHPSYPILHKKVFLEKYSRTHREFSAPLLAAVYVLAIQWWDHDPQLNRFQKPNVELILRIALNNYILEILKRPKLSAVQAGLLLLQCKHILRSINASHAFAVAYGLALTSLTSAFSDSDYNDWLLCSQVVALAEELGLGLDCDVWKLPKWERGLRKRLAWAVYLEDKWLALKNSRPSHIHDVNWVVLDLAEEDFPEKHGDGDLKEGLSDINNGKKNFMNMISLSKIISEILASLFSMRAMEDIIDINEVLRIAKPVQLKLRTWYHSLPIELRMNSVQPRKLCSNGYLQLAYFAAELTLHRKIITTLYQQNVNGCKIPDELLNVCRSAARTRLVASIEFVKDLKPEHIHSFWHSSASSNFTLIGTFAALLFISASSKEEAKDFKEKIFDYRWVLKISAKGFVQIGDSLQNLDLVMNHIPGLLNESSEQPTMVPNVPTMDYNKAFQQQQQQQQQQHANISRQPSLPHHLQHLPHLLQLPALQQVSILPQLRESLKQSSQQQQTYAQSGKDQRPFARRQNSSGQQQGLFPYAGATFVSGSPNVGGSSAGNFAAAGQNQHYGASSGQIPHLPFGSSLVFQGQIYNPQLGNVNTMRANSVSAHSPRSALGRSPKDTTRQQRTSFAKSSLGDGGSNHSTPNQGIDTYSHTETESPRNSDMLTRSPHTQQQQQHHHGKLEEDINLNSQ